MWTRRKFIRALGAGLLSASMVRDLVASKTPLLLIPDPVKQVYQYHTYQMGFKISKEMLEDDIYGSPEQMREMAIKMIQQAEDNALND